jgi:hypothetical protein
MLPPTIITAPTSETARPKAASSTVSTAMRSSHSSSRPLVHRPAPSERSCSPFCSQLDSTALARQRGHDRHHQHVCAITIRPGVNSRPQEPSGPERDSSR